ncbi:MAG: hypothetical protein AMXMBFR59_12990 [Rhodanobacteraceae bacterium]
MSEPAVTADRYTGTEPEGTTPDNRTTAIAAPCKSDPEMMLGQSRRQVGAGDRCGTAPRLESGASGSSGQTASSGRLTTRSERGHAASRNDDLPPAFFPVRSDGYRTFDPP